MSHRLPPHVLSSGAAAVFSEKEVVLFLQRLAHLESNGATLQGPARALWQRTFLDLLYMLCTRPCAPHVSLLDL